MSDKVASASTSISAPTASLPTVEEINEWTRDRVKEFLQEKNFERWGIPGAPAKKLERLLKQIKGEQPSGK
ncbi:unnamed protein product [Rhizophagus irregularis]|nr:unnamed protein product [Rhizophagus irregularis]